MKSRLNAAYRWAETYPATVALVALGLGVVVGAGVAYTIAVNRSQDTAINHIVKVEKTPCNQNPKGRKCAELRLEIAEGEPLRNPCTSYQRVTGVRGRNCHRLFVDPDRHGAATEPDDGGSEGTPAPGKSGSEAPSAPHSTGAPVQSAPPGGSHSHGGSPSAPSHPGHAGSGPAGPSEPAAPAAPRTEPEQESPREDEDGNEEGGSARAVSPGLIEEVGGAVESTGNAAAGTVEAVGKTGCAVLGNCQ